MSERVLIDTDVIIDVLRKRPIESSKEALKKKSRGENLRVSSAFLSILS